MKKIVLRILGIVYVLLAICLTVCLLNYNDLEVPQFGNSMLLVPEKDTDNLSRGDLLITKISKEFNVDDEVIYLDSSNKVKMGTISSINDEIAMVGSDNVDTESLIGLKSNTKFIGFIGYLLVILTNKIIYLFLVVLPILVLFIYEIYLIVKCIKEEKNGDFDEKVKKTKNKGNKTK